MSIGSLFSGIGGFELGLEWAGLGPVKFQCEIDLFCRQVLSAHWPGIPIFDDVHDIRREVLGELSDVSLLCGGFP